MAIKANVRCGMINLDDAILHVIFDVRRNNSRQWHIAYQVTRRRERLCTAEKRILLDEWRSQPEKVAAFEVYAEAHVETPRGLALKDWLASPEVATEWQAWVEHVRATRIEYFYEPIPGLQRWFETDSPDDLTAQTYNELKRQPEIENAVDI